MTAVREQGVQVLREALESWFRWSHLGESNP